MRVPILCRPVKVSTFFVARPCAFDIYSYTHAHIMDFFFDLLCRTPLDAWRRGFVRSARTRRQSTES